MFSYEFCEAFKNIFSKEHLRTTATAHYMTKNIKFLLSRFYQPPFLHEFSLVKISDNFWSAYCLL